ncbi:MAG: Ig-like domain-containing protein [Ruminiclostridium sp.]|nr:Ig-like domain-containing protein [Ruminiclostridium sp.]
MAVLLAVFMVFTVLPVQAFAFNPDNYKATIQNVKIGAPITGSDGRKYLPATVTFTASEDLGDQNAIFFLEGYLKTKLASGKSSEGINGLGMTLIGPLKPDALDGAGSNAFSWSFSGGSGMGILKYNLPLLNPGETQTVEQSPYTGQMEVNALTVGDKVTLTIESVFNTSYIPADPVTSKGFTFTIEGESNYPKNITKSEDDDPNTWKTKFNSTNHWQECVEGPKKGEKQNNEPHSLSSEEMALNVNMPVDFDLSKPLSSENTPYLTNDSGAMQFKFSGSGFTSQFGGAEGETTTQKFYMSNFAPVTGAYEEMTALNGKVCSDCKYVQITGYRQAVAFYDESIPEIALQLEAAIDKPVTTAGQKIKLTVKIKKSASAPSVKLMLRGKDGAVNAKLISESVKEAELNASVIEEPNLAVAEPDEYSIVEIEQEWEYTMPASNVTVSIEREKTAVLHYDANGGTGTAPADQTVVVGKSVTIDDAELKKEDFNFIYWNTKADGSGDTYYAGDTITLDADTTLFAQYGGMIMIELPPVYISSIAKPFRLVELGGDYENAYIAYIPYGASTADAKAALDGIKLNLPAAYKDKLRVSSWLYYYDNDTQNELPATMTYNTIYALPMFALTGTFKVGETINIPAMYEQVYVAYWGADWDLEDDSWVFTLFEGDYELGYEGVIPATEDTPECFSFSLTPLNDEGEHDDEEDTAELYLATNGADTDPIGVKCIGGTGSYDDPYLFAPVFAIPVESIRFTAVAPTVVVGSKATLTITTDPADATTDDFVWSSDDESIATVDKGVVTGKKPGTTTITVTGKNELGEDVSATVTLTVSTSGGAKPTPSPSGGSSSTGTSGGSSSSGSVSGTKDESGNVDVTLNDNNSLTLSWKRPQGTSSTVVYAKKTGEKKFSVLAKTTKNKLSILNVKNNTTYEFKLAFISGGVEDDLGGKYNAKINVYYKPAPKATTGDGTVVLKWKAVKGATKYRVCVLDGKTLKKVGETTKTSVRIRSVKKGKTYKYAVKAQVNGKWTSVKSSDIVTVKVK